jgi:hypothetical protein
MCLFGSYEDSLVMLKLQEISEFLGHRLVLLPRLLIDHQSDRCNRQRNANHLHYR